MAILDKLFCSLFVWLAVLALIATASPDFVASTSVSNTSNSTNLTSFTKSVIRPTPLGMNFTCDDAHVDDKHYFHFTAENFYCSNVVEWYANWTIQKQTSPEWKELGEWKSFGSDFLQDYNLNCGAALATCHDTATRWELQRMYPGPENLERVRRIFFVLNMYNLFHEYESSMEKGFEQVHLRLIGIVPDLIETFTPQVDSYRERACRVYHAMTSTAINLLWQLAGNAVGSAVAPWIDPGESLWWVQPTLAGGKRFGRGGEASPIEAYKGLNHQAGLGKEMQLQGMSTWYINLPMLHYQSYEGIIHDTVVGKFLNIKGGMGLGTMCAAEGGDFKDNNPANIKKLNELLPEKFSGIRKNLRDMFSHLYHGHVDIPGEPSLMAKTILTKAWFGPGSVTDFLEDTIPMERYLERSMVVEFASRLLSESYNYMKCAHRDDGYKMCAKAEHAKKYGELKLSYEGKYHYQKSFWCPKPEEDPNLVCQVLKWYFAINRQHEMEFIAWDKLQNFAGGRYNLTWPVLFQESWENYERFRNNFTVPLDDLFFANGGFGSGFFLPTCVNEHVQFADYNTMLTVHHTRWNFPGMCGDYRANETAAFMELMGAGPESDVHTRSEPKEFWRDRIPRALHKHITPFSHYMATCGQNVHWPQYKEDQWNLLERWRVKYNAKDKDCDMISEATKDMDETESNRWFCKGKPHHGVFERERSHVDTSEAPFERLKNHRDMCKDWKVGKLPLEPPKLVDDLEVVQTHANQTAEASRDVNYEEE